MPTKTTTAYARLLLLSHGSEYFKANECQRLVTSEECTLGTRDMLVFGLQLQYQFAHNPFCEHVPVAEWWPEPSRGAPGAAGGGK